MKPRLRLSVAWVIVAAFIFLASIILYRSYLEEGADPPYEVLVDQGVSVSMILIAFGFFILVVDTIASNRRTAFEQEILVLEAQSRAYTEPDSRISSEKNHDSLADVTMRSMGDSRHQSGALFDLYTKQINSYQTETKWRATISFVMALLAMTAGISFVVWGGLEALKHDGLVSAVAGAGIATIGGSLSAYITKTFLDAHRLSLVQLNRYFRQPVINSHILTAQQLADRLTDDDARKLAYQTIIKKVVDLIEDDVADLVVTASDTARRRRTTKRPVGLE